MKKLIQVVMFISLFYPVNAKAIETDKAAHLGISYALTTITYGFLRKTVGMPVMASCIFSSTIVSFGTLVSEGMQRHSDMGDILANEVGIGLSIGTMLVFNF